MPVVQKPVDLPDARLERSRKESVRFAIASASIEGLLVEPETEQLLKDWAEGRLSTEDLIESAKNGPQPVFAPGNPV